MRRIAHRWGVWVLWLLALLLLAAAMLTVRERLDKAHIALLFLLVVLGGSAAGGRALGLTLALSAFLVFNVFFLPPLHTLVVHDPRDWLILLVFLATGAVAAQLLYRAQSETAIARRRAEEVDRLAALGAETLGAGRAEEALAAITGVIRTTLAVAECEVWLRDATTGEFAAAGRMAGDSSTMPTPASVVAWVADQRRAAAELTDGTIRFSPEPTAAAFSAALQFQRDVHALSVPLVVRDRTVGVLRLVDPGTVVLDQERGRFLDALAYYAALGAERVRLSAEAERAEALREADRLKDALLAAVSHDIRTPLTTIRALAHDIARQGDHRALVIEEEVERLNRFVTDLLDLSRLSAGAVPVATAINAADDLLGAVLQRVEGLAAGREINAALDPAEPLLVGRFDFVHSLRIVGNLLENALKYAPHDRPIDLVARRDGDTLVFSVSDRGPGIMAGEEERIFERFYWQPGTAPDARGAGLGLAIARGLAEAQGGSLHYAAREGGGSVFSLRVPAVDVSAIASA